MADFRVPPCGKMLVCRGKKDKDTEFEAEEALLPTRVTMCLPMVVPDTATGGRKIPKDTLLCKVVCKNEGMEIVCAGGG